MFCCQLSPAGVSVLYSLSLYAFTFSVQRLNYLLLNVKYVICALFFVTVGTVLDKILQ